MQDILHQIRLHPSLKGAADILVTAIGRQCDQPRPRIIPVNRRGCLNARQNRHAKIQQRHIWQMRTIELNRLLPVRSLRHHGHIGLQIDDRADADPGHQVVFRNQNPDSIRILHGNGAVTSTLVPLPG